MKWLTKRLTEPLQDLAAVFRNRDLRRLEPGFVREFQTKMADAGGTPCLQVLAPFLRFRAENRVTAAHVRHHRVLPPGRVASRSDQGGTSRQSAPLIGLSQFPQSRHVAHKCRSIPAQHALSDKSLQRLIDLGATGTQNRRQIALVQPKA